jgi:hypothetical protein
VVSFLKVNDVPGARSLDRIVVLSFVFILCTLLSLLTNVMVDPAETESVDGEKEAALIIT